MGYATPTGAPCPRAVRVDGTVSGSGDCCACGCCLLLIDAAWPDAGDVDDAYAAAMPAPRVLGFTHVSLSVGDLDRSLGFYRDLLGLPTLAEPFEGEVFEGREAMLLAGRSALCLQEHRANTGAGFDPHVTGLDHISLAVGSTDDLDAYAAHLDGAGVEHSGVKPLPGFGHFIELRDPDGILVELHAMPPAAR